MLLCLLLAGCLSKPSPRTWDVIDGEGAHGDVDVQQADGKLDSGPDVFEVECVPDCEGKECGDDGCGGNCGECGDFGACKTDYTCLCEFDKCQDNCCEEGEVCLNSGCCLPDCGEKECGDNGCGGSCGDCGAKEQCGEAGYCQCMFEQCGNTCCESADEVCYEDACCLPECTDKECGSNGCGGVCAECSEHFACLDLGDTAVCQPICDELCESLECGTAGPNGECECGECDDGNPCTDDLCDDEQKCGFPANTEPCDDGNPCTEPDLCQDGICTGQLLSLDELAEQALLDECLCATDEDCLAVEDGDLCNGLLHCYFGGEEEPFGTCLVDSDTMVTCPDDNLWCTGVEACDPSSGNCIHLEVPELNDGSECTLDSCDEEYDTVVNVPDDTACDDTNVCTYDSCDPTQGCVHLNNEETCAADVDGCTIDQCVNGDCLVVGTFDCSLFADQCSSGDCISTGTYSAECKKTPIEGDCNDQNECTNDDLCSDGLCAGQEINCEDSNPCTDDSCDPAQGCINMTIDCDDQDACTDDMCKPGTALGCEHTPVECDDGNGCTEDTCAVDSGCLFSPLVDEISCGDGLWCMAGECVLMGLEDLDHDGVCSLGTCVPQKEDTCPTTWNPDNDSTVCGTLKEGFGVKRSIFLTQPGSDTGASAWRRTHEPLEVPLWNGIVDDSVSLLLSFGDGNLIDTSSQPISGITVDGSQSYVLSHAEAFDQALELDVDSCLVVPDTFSYPLTQFTVMAWVMQPESYGDVLDNGTASTNSGFGLWSEPGKLHASAGDGSNYCSAEGVVGELFSFDEWYHVSATFDAGTFSLFANGILVGTHECEDVAFVISDGLPAMSGCNNNQKDKQPMLLDDLAVFSRVLSPHEIAAYYYSNAQYGTKFTPGVQPDFDDLRVTETTPFQTEHQLPFEVIGPRPHSDTPCPMDEDDGTWANREDLCGVVAYWALDGDGVDVTGKHDGHVHGGLTVAGAFGKQDVALQFGSGNVSVEIPHDDELGELGAVDMSFTIEAWVLIAPGDDCGGVVASKVGVGQSVQPFALSVNKDCSASFSFQVTTEEACIAFSSVLLSKGRWHHIAGERDREANESRVFVDGLPTGSSVDNCGDLSTNSTPMRLGCGSTGTGVLGSWFSGRIDDVLIHSVAKSPEYIYRRANPGIPMVRFLASTEPETNDTGGYEWYSYALHWGDGEAMQRPPILAGSVPDQKCYGLLSPCLGYAGWWRFNEGSGTVAVDSSTWKGNGTLQNPGGTASYTASAESIGIATGATSYDHPDGWVSVPHGQGVASPVTEVTMESLVLISEEFLTPGGDKSGVLVGKHCCYPDDGHATYLMYQWGPNSSDLPEDSIRLDFKPQGVVASSPSGALGADGIWHSVRGTYSSGQGAVLVDDESWLFPDMGQASFQYDGGEPLAIGAWKSCSGNLGDRFKGIIDSTRIMSRALTPDELLQYPMAAWEYGGGNWDLDCGGIICPELDGYNVLCNGQDHCEYVNEDDSGWKQWDVWIYVPPGSFQMGSEGEGGGLDEMPVHPVTISQGYFIGKYEIVVAQYEACQADDLGTCTPADTTDWPGVQGTNTSGGGKLEHPQNGLTWQQALDFCGWIAPGGRLPTEAEWEYAATGPVHLKYPWGDSPEPTCSNSTTVFNEAGGGNSGIGCWQGGTWKAGSMISGASWCGALDMAGNLWEWCADWSHDSYANAPNDGSAWQDPPGSSRVLRGGSMTEPANFLRSARRGADTPGSRRAHRGARCLRP
jgi:formylglycine-generating enzyme required for sulfatase activity